MIVTGEYYIRYFNKYGTELKSLKEIRPSFESAKQRGIVRTDKKDVYSYAIDRRVYNSLDAE